MLWLWLTLLHELNNEPKLRPLKGPVCAFLAENVSLPDPCSMKVAEGEYLLVRNPRLLPHR